MPNIIEDINTLDGETRLRIDGGLEHGTIICKCCHRKTSTPRSKSKRYKDIFPGKENTWLGNAYCDTCKWFYGSGVSGTEYGDNKRLQVEVPYCRGSIYLPARFNGIRENQIVCKSTLGDREYVKNEIQNIVDLGDSTAASAFSRMITNEHICQKEGHRFWTLPLCHSCQAIATAYNETNKKQRVRTSVQWAKSQPLSFWKSMEIEVPKNLTEL